MCQNGKKLCACGTKKRKSRTGYESEKTIYRSKDCSGCPYKKACIKGNHCKTPLEEQNKIMEVGKQFSACIQTALGVDPLDP